MNRVRSLVVVVAIVAAACSTSSESSSDTTTTAPATDVTTTAGSADTTDSGPTSSGAGDAGDSGSDSSAGGEDIDPADLTDSFRGVTAAEISLGVGFWDTSLFGFGFLGDPAEVWTALTEAQNARGGVNGRNLRATTADFNPADPATMLAACIELTEDNEVFAVLGGMRGDANNCVYEQHETILLGSQVVVGDDTLDRARAPVAGFFTDALAASLARIEALDELGWLEGNIGVHFDEPAVRDTLEEPVLAALAEVGVTDPTVLFFDDLAVDEDQAEQEQEILQQQAIDAELDKVIGFGPAAFALITYPDIGIELAVSEPNNFATALNQDVAPETLDGTLAASARVNLPDDPVDELTQRCLDDFAAAQPDRRLEPAGPGVEDSEDDPNHYSYVVLACRDLELFVQAATASGADLTNDTFATGLASLEQTSLPEVPFVSFGPDKFNGGDTLRMLEYDASADEDGELVAVTDAIDLTQ
ncbi:MAG: hypothetical protein OES57_12090 [Acidimicrobiia bacterium]|nr:hypothetical protein [Acidimicrobiia bacterium]